MIDLEDNQTTDWTGDVTWAGLRASRRSRTAAGLLAALGLALVAAPFAFQMFSRAPQGATMLSDFKPFMTSERLNGFSADIGSINASVAELDRTDAALMSPTYRDFSDQWPAINEDMSGLMADVSDNLGNYQAVAALPSFSLFPWFFVIPGVVVAGIAGLVLLFGRWTRAAQVGLALVGIGLIAAPVAFGMFTRAPKGGEMMKAFESLETTSNVARIQGYFSQMAVGQGAIRLEVVPALERRSGPADVAATLPATARLNRDWVHVLNDMTPMIGAMSDNVSHYQAIAALPPFPLFPWFFLVPGALVVGLVVSAGRPIRPVPSRGVA